MNIICISPLKKLDSPYAEAVREYEKRLGRYCKIKLFSAKSAPPPLPAALLARRCSHPKSLPPSLHSMGLTAKPGFILF